MKFKNNYQIKGKEDIRDHNIFNVINDTKYEPVLYMVSGNIIESACTFLLLHLHKNDEVPPSFAEYW